jgi:3-oxoacyl-[acyl-carrier-protein] synthase-3
MASITKQVSPSQAFSKPNASLPGVQILATGASVPEVVVRNSDLSKLGCDEEWIVQRTGILERRHCRPDQSTSDLAYEAARDCLDRAGVSARDLDLIIVATMTPDHFTPSTSAIVQDRLKCTAVGIDLNAACSGFMYGLITGGQFLQTRSYRRVLVIGADAMSRVIDPEDVKTYPLFGDAAGAALLAFDPEADEEGTYGIRGWQMGTAGDLGYLISVPGACARMPASEQVLRERLQFLKMDGKPVFKWAVRTIPVAIADVLELAHMTIDDIDLLLLHQANQRIIDAALPDIGISPDRVHVNLQSYGNTSAASIPLLLHESLQEGGTTLENRILMCGFGAGLTWGSVIYQGRPA